MKSWVFDQRISFVTFIEIDCDGLEIGIIPEGCSGKGHSTLDAEVHRARIAAFPSVLPSGTGSEIWAVLEVSTI